jgi:putative ABC transport system permease protein
MIGTVFIGQQFSYINSKPLGYETSNRYRFWLPWEKIAEIGDLLKEELKKQSDIEMVSGKSGDFNMTKFRIDGNETDYIYYEHIDDQHLQLMNIPLVTGRYFSKAFSQDTVSNLVVNESFVKNILPKNVDPLQHALKGTEITYNIVGVVKDFHYDNFKENIQPMVFFMDKGTEAGMVHVKIKEGRSTQALSAIQSIYKQFEPDLPLEYQTLEEVRMDRYTEELREKKIITYTSVLAILIASLGLFGLATFMTEQRIKEIGIRKVLGAKVSQITILLSKDFIQLVILSFVLAVPVGYYFVDRWLQNFTYRIDIEWWVFGIIGTAGVVIALITVSYQTLKTALSDPIKALQND